jgi:hypothetical protein
VHRAPWHHNDRVSAPSLRILVLSNFRPAFANVVRDFLFSFNAYSRHRYYYVFDCASLDRGTDFSSFDVILLFWTLFPLGPEITPELRGRIRAARAIKVAFLQDEYRDVRASNTALQELGVKVVFTTVSERDHDTFYPRSLIDTLEATYTVLTGYVPAYLENLPPAEARERPLDVGYRSRVSPFHFGDLGREKSIIADRFRDICREHGLRADISVRERDRIHGRAWLRFVRRSRCMLGTASGASVVDFSGRIRTDCELYLARFPDASYEDVKARFFAEADGKVVIETISPRAFEAAALHSTMVHHEGDYAGILEPDRHFVRVKRDYSNVPEVVDRIKDHAYCRLVAAAAHRDLVSSGRYSYRAFAQEFDARLARHAPPPSPNRAVSRVAFYARGHRWGQPLILPRGDRFVLGPIAALQFGLAAAVLNRMPANRRTAAASRFLLDPMRFLQLSQAAWVTIAMVPALRAILQAYLRSAEARARTTMMRVAEDLLKLDAVRRARGGIHPIPPFSIDLDFDRRSGELTLTSAAQPAARPPGSEPLLDEIESALKAGGVRTIVWNHTAIAHRVSCPRWPFAPVSVGLGNGVHRFDALAAVCGQAPAAASALRAILAGLDTPRDRGLAASSSQ